MINKRKRSETILIGAVELSTLENFKEDLEKVMD